MAVFVDVLGEVEGRPRPVVVVPGVTYVTHTSWMPAPFVSSPSTWTLTLPVVASLVTPKITGGSDLIPFASLLM